MSEFEEVFIEANKWLTISGVETVIPNQEEKSLMVLTSSTSILLTNLIPERFKGYNVILCYVHGLSVKTRKHGRRQDLETITH